MYNQFERLIRMSGVEAYDRLQHAHVAIVGLGGVGGHACEAVARSGVGKLTLIDFDTVDLTNLNRQIVATHNVLGEKKVEIMQSRLKNINPSLKIDTHNMFLSEENCSQLITTDIDYVIDAIDSLPSKISLIKYATRNNINIISSMGTGNKWDPSRLEIEDIFNTSVDPIARKLRAELKKLKINNLTVVYSKEIPVKYEKSDPYLIGSNAFVPATAGILMASYVIRSLIGNKV